MARLKVEPMDALLAKLQQLGKIDDVAPKMVDGATLMILLQLQKNIRIHRLTGQLENSLKQVKGKKSKTGAYVGSVRATGYDVYSKPTATFPKGTPNEVKLMGIEYGSSREPARPILQRSINESENDALEYMQTIYDIEVGPDG